LILVQSVSQLSTSLELSHLLSSNLDLSLCSGVDTLASGTLSNSECTEANESNLVTSDEGILDSSYSSIESLFCINLRETSTSCNLLNQFSLVHNFLF